MTQDDVKDFFVSYTNTDRAWAEWIAWQLEQDLMAIVTVFASRLHGLRSYKKAIKDAALKKD